MAKRIKMYLIDKSTAVSETVLNDMKTRGTKRLNERLITKDEIKKGKIHIYKDSDYFEHIRWNDFKAFHHGKTFTAVVNWFDNTRGLGVVTLNNGTDSVIYACNIKGKKTWYPETACVYYTKGQTVDVEIECIGHKSFAKGLTEGTLDVEGWDRIKDKDLAFRCNKVGEAVTGLFK